MTTDGSLDVILDRALWRVEEGALDGEEALEQLDYYRERVAEEVKD